MADMIEETLEAMEAKPVNITELTDEEVKADVAEEPIPEPKDEDEDLPEKYRGKSKAELARMHEEAQSALGRQSNEVGELRKVFDEYIQSNVRQSQEAPTQEEDPVDFLLEPEKAVRKMIENDPEIQKTREVQAALLRQTQRDRILNDFPDIAQVVSDPKFIEWKDASPIRQKLFKDADQFDYTAVKELMENWKDRNRVVEDAKKMEADAQKEAVKEAATGNVRGNPDVQRRKKVYRRADIIKLMKDDPSRYAALQDEIMQAYQEGRVK